MKKPLLFTIFFLATLCLNNSVYAQQLDSLRKILNLVTEDTMRMRILNEIGFEILLTKPEEARIYSKNALSLAEKLNSIQQKALAHRVIGRSYFYSSKYEKSLAHYYESKKYYAQLNDDIGLSIVLVNIGNINFTLGKTVKAVTALHEVLNLNAKVTSRINALINLGAAIADYGYIDESYSYYMTALELARENNDKKGETYILGNLAIYYFKKGNLKLAEQYCYDAIDLSKKLKVIFNPAYLYITLGDIAVEKREYKVGEEFYNKAVNLSQDPSEKRDLISCYTQLAILNKEKKKFNLAIHYLKMAEKIKLEKGNLILIKEIYKNFLDIYQAIGNHKLSSKYFNSYIEVNDSIYSVQNGLQLAQMKTKYEVSRKEFEIKQQQKEINLLNEIIDNESKITILKWSLVSLLLILIIIITFILNYRQKLKLKKQESQIKHKNSELLDFAFHIVGKNNFMENVKSSIKKIKKDIVSESAKEQISSLEKLITINSNLEKNRDDFNEKMDQICDDFFFKLENKFPGLTYNDKKLAALTRINLSSKEIAALFNISSHSVDVNRYRLRKKLGLQRSQNLNEFLNKI